MEPPFSIPNKEVKRISADDSCGATHRENKSGPGLERKKLIKVSLMPFRLMVTYY
jgi:hypothetical protein